MWSILYILVEFLIGRLPWSDEKDKDEVLELKVQYNPDKLIQGGLLTYEVMFVGLYPELEKFVGHIKSLSFFDEPDYDFLRSLLRGILANQGSPNRPFPWENASKKKNPFHDKNNLKDIRLVGDKLIFSKSIRKYKTHI